MDYYFQQEQTKFYKMVKKKKSYNPFKMWGSYFGAIMGSSIYLVKNIGTKVQSHGIFNFTENLMETIPYFIILIFYIFLGFLIGWGIHSLVWKYKK